MRPRTGFLGRAPQLQLANLSCSIWKAASRMPCSFALLFFAGRSPCQSEDWPRVGGQDSVSVNLRLHACAGRDEAGWES